MLHEKQEETSQRKQLSRLPVNRSRLPVNRRRLPLRNTRIGDLTSEEELLPRSSASIAPKKESVVVPPSLLPRRNASIAPKNKSVVVPPSLRGGPSNRGDAQASTSSSSTLPLRSSAKTSKAGRAAKTLATTSSTGNLRSLSATARRSRSSEPKTRAHAKLRSVASAGDLHCTVAASAALITITTAQGQTVTFSEETKGEVNLDLLDDVAWHQLQKLESLLKDLLRRRCQR
ncbi:uncharacterized protein LOC130522774 [Takifugu flavidus]|uniref:uncharacterized protein LOC130522774 n=1 Tax=Takifugu flavidus TaxID=433684 RepID=UPI0025449D4A|nr:uncharacterized protein LOC130522774 [Takifugu flavidus]